MPALALSPRASFTSMWTLLDSIPVNSRLCSVGPLLVLRMNVTRLVGMFNRTRWLPRLRQVPYLFDVGASEL